MSRCGRPQGEIVLDRPIVAPLALSATTATCFAPAGNGNAFSKADFTIVCAARPSTTGRHLATSVAPFQLTYTLSSRTATAGLSVGCPCHTNLYARYESASWLTPVTRPRNFPNRA